MSETKRLGGTSTFHFSYAVRRHTEIYVQINPETLLKLAVRELENHDSHLKNGYEHWRKLIKNMSHKKGDTWIFEKFNIFCRKQSVSLALSKLHTKKYKKVSYSLRFVKQEFEIGILFPEMIENTE